MVGGTAGLAIRSLRFFAKSHIAIALGVAAATAVIVGALVVEITTDLRRRFAAVFDAGFASPALLDDDDAHNS